MYWYCGTNIESTLKVGVSCPLNHSSLLEVVNRVPASVEGQLTLTFNVLPVQSEWLNEQWLWEIPDLLITTGRVLCCVGRYQSNSWVLSNSIERDESRLKVLASLPLIRGFRLCQYACQTAWSVIWRTRIPIMLRRFVYCHTLFDLFLTLKAAFLAYNIWPPEWSGKYCSSWQCWYVFSSPSGEPVLVIPGESDQEQEEPLLVQHERPGKPNRVDVSVEIWRHYRLLLVRCMRNRKSNLKWWPREDVINV